MTSRLVLYGAISMLGAASVVGSALHTRANFYAAAVAVGRSSGALMVLANFALFNTICFGIAVKTLFFGRLRSIEYEHLFERLWLFLTESLLALTIFRDDFSAPFAVMYGVLLFLKCFHWITADRVDYMDQIPPPGPPTIFHIRCSTIIGLLTFIDCALVVYSLESIVVDGVSAMVLFASEFMILLASITGTSARYGVGLVDLRRARGREDAPSWEEKSMYLFYVDLAVDFAKLLTYLTFFLVILLNYGLPLHILRDVYMTLRSFLSRCSDLVRYRRATKDMDSLYPNATTEDLARNGDRTCIICREEMVPHQTPAERATAAAAATAAGTAVPPPAEEGGPNETPKRLQCGHIFHFHCLRSWLERQQSCPTCRRDVLRTPASTRPGPRPGQNGVNVQINPPAPAPGAVPRANAQPGLPNPIQEVYDHYFRLLQPLAQAALPAAAPTAPPAQPPQADRDQTIQSGIWGGPIAPGRFFATPLGAAPVWPPSSSSNRQQGLNPAGVSVLAPRPTRSQGVNMPVIRLPEPGSGSGSSSQTATPPSSTLEPSSSTDRPPPPPPVDVQSGSHIPGAVSGSNTPFTSNPPQIFDQPGWGGEVQSAEAEQEQGDARKAAAEAALRRMGLRSSTRTASASAAGSSAAGLSRIEPTLPDLPAAGPSPRPRSDPEQSSSSVPPPRVEPSSNGKGKERALPIDPLDEQPSTTPYLTLPGSDLLSFSSSLSDRLSTSRPGEAGAMTMDDTQAALEERLQLLREVDEVVWGLVGELSKVRSGWQSAAERDGVGSGDT